MKTNEPVDWLDEILKEVYSEGIHNIDGKRGMNFTINQAKATIKSKLDSQQRFKIVKIGKVVNGIATGWTFDAQGKVHTGNGSGNWTIAELENISRLFDSQKAEVIKEIREQVIGEDEILEQMAKNMKRRQ